MTFFEKRFRLFIKDVPIASLEADEKCLISTNGKPLEEITDTLSVRTNAFRIFFISFDPLTYFKFQFKNHLRTFILGCRYYGGGN